VVNRNATSPWPFVGMAGMACAFFLYAASGLVAPWWATLLLFGSWLVMFVVATRWWSRHPGWVPVLALFAIALWFAVALTGGLLLDWEPWWGWTP
jgi:phosphatidylglycerophosphate synthase